MKKLFSILLLSAVLIGVLASCGTQGSTDSQNSENNNIKQMMSYTLSLTVENI